MQRSERPFHDKWPLFFSESPFHQAPDPHVLHSWSPSQFLHFESQGWMLKYSSSLWYFIQLQASEYLTEIAYWTFLRSLKWTRRNNLGSSCTICYNTNYYARQMLNWQNSKEENFTNIKKRMEPQSLVFRGIVFSARLRQSLAHKRISTTKQCLYTPSLNVIGVSINLVGNEEM